jgi:hypothetical protein
MMAVHVIIQGQRRQNADSNETHSGKHARQFQADHLSPPTNQMPKKQMPNCNRLSALSTTRA